MNSYGITPAFADLLLASLNGIRTNLPVVCAQLHDGDPGSQGINNPSAITTRQPLTFTAPDNGATALSGGVPTWSVSAGETLQAISLWSGLETDPTAVCLFTLRLSVATPIAAGDVVVLSGCDLEWWDAANKIWPPILTITAGTAQGQASALAPTLVASSIIEAPTANASASALEPTVFLGTIVAAPTAGATSLAFVPTIDLDLGITAPAATATATALLPIPSTAITAPVASANGSALAATVSGTAALTAPTALGSSSALVPTVTAVSPVTYTATGAGGSGTGSSGATMSWSHTISGNALIVAVSLESGSTTTTATAKVGTTSMTLLGSAPNFNNSGYYARVVLFGLLSPPTGSQTITVTTSGGANYLEGNSVSYTNVTSFGSVVTGSGTSSAPALSVSSAANQMVVESFTTWSTNPSSYTQTSRYSLNINSPYRPFLIGDAPGASTVSFSAASSDYWSAIAVPLI